MNHSWPEATWLDMNTGLVVVDFIFYWFREAYAGFGESQENKVLSEAK